MSTSSTEPWFPGGSLILRGRDEWYRLLTNSKYSNLGYSPINVVDGNYRFTAADYTNCIDRFDAGSGI